MVAPRTGRFQAREVRNTITVNSTIATTTISDPTIGAATNASPFNSTTATPAGKQDRADHVEPALHLGEARGSGSRDQPIIQAEQEQEAAADQVEKGVRGRELKGVRESRSSRPVPVFVT
jgi:hypothetical protein